LSPCSASSRLTGSGSYPVKPRLRKTGDVACPSTLQARAGPVQARTRSTALAGRRGHRLPAFSADWRLTASELVPVRSQLARVGDKACPPTLQIRGRAVQGLYRSDRNCGNKGQAASSWPCRTPSIGPEARRRCYRATGGRFDDDKMHPGASWTRFSRENWETVTTVSLLLSTNRPKEAPLCDFRTRIAQRSVPDGICRHQIVLGTVLGGLTTSRSSPREDETRPTGETCVHDALVAFGM
jgi:hypothetical protein